MHEASSKGWNSQVGSPARASMLESAIGAGAASAVATKTKTERKVVNCIFSDCGLSRFFWFFWRSILLWELYLGVCLVVGSCLGERIPWGLYVVVTTGDICGSQGL